MPFGRTVPSVQKLFGKQSLKKYFTLRLREFRAIKPEIILQKLFGAMTKWPLRKSTPGSMRKNSEKAESNNEIAQSPRKQFPKSCFTQSIATISRNRSVNIIPQYFLFARAMFSEWRVNFFSKYSDFESAKTDLGFRRGTFERQICLFRLIKVLYPRGENCLQTTHFYKQKGPCFKNPLKLDRVSFSTPDNSWWAFRPREKIFSPPPSPQTFPPPRALPPPTPPPPITPPSLCF